uniref:C2H2-type domain-containing protein n=1 Tax=Haemonchus placei TaxID=6290 RepID=A0A0N4WFU8_HAEPC
MPSIAIDEDPSEKHVGITSSKEEPKGVIEQFEECPKRAEVTMAVAIMKNFSSPWPPARDCCFVSHRLLPYGSCSTYFHRSRGCPSDRRSLHKKLNMHAYLYDSSDHFSYFSYSKLNLCSDTFHKRRKAVRCTRDH